MSETYPQTGKDADVDNNLIKISNSVLYRLKCDSKVDTATSESQWLDKLATLDWEHTIATGLDITQTEKLLNHISSTYVTTSTQLKCPFDTIKLTECLKYNKGNTIVCEPEVERFKQCVDKALHDTVATKMPLGSRAKTGSYTERFERMYQL